MSKLSMTLFAVPLLLAGTLHAQQRGDFYNGMRNGGSNGQYEYHNEYNRNARYGNNYNSQRDYNRGDRRDYRGDRNDYHGDAGYNRENRQGGIGPGKGALIGGAGGAILGGVFGGGLKGSIIGGAAGAGIGAIAGQAHQNHERRDNGYYPR